MGATGTTTVDFGSGTTEAQVAIIGQAGIVAGSLVDAWLQIKATGNHSDDEHVAEAPAIYVRAGTIVAATGFTIYASYAPSPASEPSTPPPMGRFSGTAQFAGGGKTDSQVRDVGGRTYKLTGTWTVSWVWN